MNAAGERRSVRQDQVKQITEGVKDKKESMALREREEELKERSRQERERREGRGRGGKRSKARRERERWVRLARGLGSGGLVVNEGEEEG